MKTAVSLPNDLFDLAESTAKRLGVSRSELYAKAIAEFLQRCLSENVTDRLNQVYVAERATVDPSLHRAQLRSVKDSW